MNKKKVLITGSFSVLHPGHLRLFRFAKECGNLLIVGVNSDRIARTLVHERLRLEGVQSNNWVDEAFLMDEPVTEVISRFKPDIVIKGKEHELRFNPELAVLEQYGGKLVFSSGEVVFSSLDLIRKEFLESDLATINLPNDYLERHQIDRGQLIERVRRFSKLKVCVLGDLIIDEYITCQALGMSQEDPTVVVKPIERTRFIGGAGIVASHAAGLDATVYFLSIAGDDPVEKFALERLQDAKVNAYILQDLNRPTTLKQRFRSQGKSLLRVSHLHQGAISLALQKQMLEIFEQILDSVDLVVFSDFNYGCLPQPLVEQIISMAENRHVIIVADSQSSSQTGDVARFRNMDLITPTEREARISTRNNEDGLVILAEQLRKQSNAKNVLLKLGEEGILIHASKKGKEDWDTDRVGAMNLAPQDVSGAGDSLLITSAMTLACGGNIWEAAFLGSLAAAIQVGRVGNLPIQTAEFLQELS